MSPELFQLPIPDWGLSCPRCDYPLRGLPSHRCPECGLEIHMERLVRSWTRLRDPELSGAESPFPDCGLECAKCRAPLAGAAHQRCSACMAAFDPAALRPTGPWFRLPGESLGGMLVGHAENLLFSEGVPYVHNANRTTSEIMMGAGFALTPILVPSEFFFDALALLRAECLAIEQRRALGRIEQPCPHCGEANPGNFDDCWQCQGSLRGDADAAT